MPDQQGPPPGPSPSKPPSLVARIEALEKLMDDIGQMMAKDRRWMDELVERIGL